jgi:WD40 repeat protein
LHFVCAVEHRNWVIGAAFSPDGKEAVSDGLAEGEITEDVIKRWETKSCRIAETPLDRERRYVQGIAYSPVGRRVAWATRSGQIWISDLDANVPPTPLPQVHTAIVAEMDFSPDGRYLVSGGRDRRVIVWDVAAKSVLKELPGHSNAVNSVKFAPTGNIVASGGSENQILVWDITRPDPLVAKLDVKGGVNRLAFNASGTVLAVGSDARYISMWSVGNWEKIFQLNTLVGVRSVFGFHPVRGDLAFDGENGMVRVLPQTDIKSARTPSGELHGMDARFDDMPTNVNSDGAASSIRLDGPACS